MRSAAVSLLAAMAVEGAGAQTSLSPPEPVEGPAQAVEGDLLVVNGLPVRLYGVDAPELGQQCRSARGTPFDCGEASRAALEGAIGQRSVRCSVYSVRSNGDRIGLCSVGGADLGSRMIASGWAFPQRHLSNRYDRLEARAQANRTGLWAGSAQRPWQWRGGQGR